MLCYGNCELVIVKINNGFLKILQILLRNIKVQQNSFLGSLPHDHFLPQAAIKNIDG